MCNGMHYVFGAVDIGLEKVILGPWTSVSLLRALGISRQVFKARTCSDRPALTSKVVDLCLA